MKRLFNLVCNMSIFAILVIMLKMFFMDDLSSLESVGIFGAFSILYQTYLYQSHYLIEWYLNDV